MEGHNVNVENGNISFLASILSTTFLWVSGQNLSDIAALFTTIFSLTSSVLAMRYYWKAGNAVGKKTKKQ